MDKFLKKLDAAMTLMEGKEGKYSVNMSGEDKINLCKQAIDSLERYIKRMEEFPNDYTDEEGSRFEIKVELNKFDKDYSPF